MERSPSNAAAARIVVAAVLWVCTAAAAGPATLPAPAAPDAARLYPVWEKAADGARRWGYIDRTGRRVIPFRYASADPFREGLALVTLGERQAFIDTTGTVAFMLPDDCLDPGRF